MRVGVRVRVKVRVGVRVKVRIRVGVRVRLRPGVTIWTKGETTKKLMTQKRT